MAAVLKLDALPTPPTLSYYNLIYKEAERAAAWQKLKV
jgi:hypothetical protein